ncbi:nuclear cap-binding protein subunit 1-B-like [Hydractinia symbiolongicarpus]|uniref:nuclear cap-binding protein subunit 1-B-like n=1 Tax=Hydractinia symbiolongicarpus TaxID=13093 RepID=UPI00254AF66B|nr:nuclear cap-binding protein subunit 1-B-like [Hydractinia symbiolongicarpus]
MSDHRKRYRDYDNDSSRDRKRPRSGPLNVEDRLESLITRVGEKSTSSLESNLEALANVLETDMQSHKQRILQILCTCVTNHPEKATIYSTLVGLLNEKSFEFGGEFLELILNNLNDVIHSGSFERARLMVRFISDLINCNFLVAASLISFLEQFINEASQSAVPQVRSDWYIYTVLSSLPWCAKELSTKKPKEFERLMDLIEVYIRERNKLHVKALRVWSSDKPHPQEEYLDCLWEQVKTMKEDDWQEKHIRRPYKAFHSVLCKALPHPLQLIKLPPHSDIIRYPLPSVIFRMFDYTDAPEEKPIPGAHAIERYLVEETIWRIICTHYKDKKECASQLINCAAKNKVSIEYIIIEILFGAMFRLPEPDHLFLFYGSLTIELCKLSPESMPGVVAQAVELLFERLDTMNITCIDRFIDWFSYHLSNFQYKWTWEDWIPYVDASTEEPKVRFITEVLGKCQRSTFQENLNGIIPDELHPLIPEPTQGFFRFEIADSEENGKNTVRKLIDGIKMKQDTHELLGVLYEIPASEKSYYDDDVIAIDPNIPALRIECFMLTILRAGLKSITHTYSALTKFHAMFTEMITNRSEQMHCLRAVREFWGRNPLMMLVVIDKMVKLQYIQCSTVVNWIFAPEMESEFTKFSTWELLHNTLKKMMKHKEKVKKDLEDAHERLDVLIDKAKKEQRNHAESDDEDDTTQLDIERRQEEIEELTEKVETAKKDQKELFLIVFQRFTMIITEHIAECNREGRRIANSWYRYTLQRLQEIFLLYHVEIDQYADKMEKLIFTPDIAPHILEVFRRYKSLRS